MNLKTKSFFVFLIACVFSSNQLAIAQKKPPKQFTGILFGTSFSNIGFGGERQSSAFGIGSVGINAEFKLSHRLYLGTTLLMGKQRSHLRVSPSITVEQWVSSLLVGPTLQFDDFRFRGGVSLEQRGAPSLEAKTENSGISNQAFGESYGELNLFLGTEFRMSPKFGFFINGTIPTAKSNSSSVQIGLKYRVHHKAQKVIKYRSLRKESAQRDILALKNGVLLVRLMTSQNKIDALTKVGKVSKAEKTRKWQREQNLLLVEAFRKNFDFAPVYFFYSHHSNDVRKGEVNGIFLNDDLEIDSSIVLTNNTVYTSEYAQIKQDTVAWLSHYELEQVGDFQFVQVPRYYGQPNLKFKAIVINNQKFEQLAEPFPYYARTNAPSIKKHPEQLLFGLPLIYFLFNDSYAAAVGAMNYKLHQYYNKVYSE